MSTATPDDQPHYSASDISVLSGLEAVRKRPGMYVGVPMGSGIPVAVAASLVMELRTVEMPRSIPTPLEVRVERLADERLKVSDNAVGLAPHLLRPSATQMFVPHLPDGRNLFVATALCSRVVVDVSIHPAGTWQRTFEGESNVGPLLELDPERRGKDGTGITCTFDPLLLASEPDEWWNDWQQRLLDEVVCIAGRPWHHSCETSCWRPDATVTLDDHTTGATLTAPLS